MLPAVVLVMVLAGGTLLAGCTSARNDLGTVDSQCFVAIPPASAAVHSRGRLLGVRLVTVASLRTRHAELYRAARDAEGSGTRSVCLVAFTGGYRARQVASPAGDRTGRMAVVVLAYPGNRVLATLLASRPPLPFGHSHIGLL